MKEIWGFAWLALALCTIVVAAMFSGSIEAGLPAFFCFLPVPFFLAARTISRLSARIEVLEMALRADAGNGSSQ